MCVFQLLLLILMLRLGERQELVKFRQALGKPAALLCKPVDIAVVENRVWVELLPIVEQITFCTVEDQIEPVELLICCKQGHNVWVASPAAEFHQYVYFSLISVTMLIVELLFDGKTALTEPLITEIVVIGGYVHHDYPSVTTGLVNGLGQRIPRGEKGEDVLVLEFVVLYYTVIVGW